MRVVPALVVASSLALGALRAASAATTATSLAPGSRILHTFDFEETSLGNFESVPMFWSKVVGRGFPAYASGRFDHDTFRSAHTSFRLDIDSGSAAYLFSPPPEHQIPINPNADYYVIGFAKTTALQYARADITSWFADEDGNLLPETERHSEPFVSAASDDAGNGNAGAWHVLHFFVPGPRPNTPEAAHAKSLVLRLAILQPQQFAADGAKIPSPLGRFQLYHQDLKGTAWFDDITVFQLPRVSVEVPAAITANIFHPGQPVNLDLTVADLARAQSATQPTTPSATQPGGSAPLAVMLKITDPDGLLFASEKWPVSTAPDHPWMLSYAHPALPPGLYTATLDVADQTTGSLIARRQTRFLCLAAMPVTLGENGLERPAPEFGISATDWPAHAWNELPTVLRDLNVGLLQLSAWRRDMSEDALQKRDPALDALLNTLQHAGIHALVALSEIPNVLAAKLADAHADASSDDSLLALSNADPALWRPYASFLLARYSTLVDRWELGSPSAPFSGTLASASAADPYPQLYTKIYSQLAGLLAQPQVLIPWNALFDFKASQYPNAILDLRIPSVIKPGQIPSYIRDFKTASTNGPIFVHIDPLDDHAYSPADRVSDFAQRIIYARSANPTATLIDLPLTQNSTDASTGARTEPEQLLLTYRTLVRTLGNTTYRREIPLGTGIHAFLFASDAGGTLALWNDGAADPQTALDLPLGNAPRAIELAGNTRPLPVDPATQLTHVPVGAMPLLIDHIDANLLELRATFAFSTSTFPAGAGFLRTNVLLANPYPDPFSATMHMNPPPGWSIDPTAFPVSIAPGGTFSQPVIVRYPYTESAGPKTVAARLTSDGGELVAKDGAARPLNLSVPVLVSSDLVETEGFARILPNGDLVLQQMITNISPIPLNAEAYALVPGYARQQRFVLDLAPSQTTIKRFVFPMDTYVNFTPKTTPAAIAAALTGKSAAVGLRQNDGKTLITKSLPIN